MFGEHRWLFVAGSVPAVDSLPKLGRCIMIVDSATNAARVSIVLACALGGDMPVIGDGDAYTINVPDTGCVFRILADGTIECDTPEVQ